jgi:hypothetical protein
MRSQYIQNLVSNLIGKNRYSELVKAPRILTYSQLLDHIKYDLFCGDVRRMRPGTLGRIMCSFDIGEVMSAHPGKEVRFSGDCEDLLRELVALCLAYAIRDRIGPVNPPDPLESTPDRIHHLGR